VYDAVHAEGYDDTKFYSAFTQSGGDLHAALASWARSVTRSSTQGH
jgi:hypothetical protein